MQVERFISNKPVPNKAFLLQSFAKDNTALVQTAAPTSWLLTSTCPGTPLPLSRWPIVHCSTTTNITDLSNGQVRQDAGKGQKHFSRQLAGGLPAACSLPWRGAPQEKGCIQEQVSEPDKYTVLSVTFWDARAQEQPILQAEKFENSCIKTTPQP